MRIPSLSALLGLSNNNNNNNDNNDDHDDIVASRSATNTNTNTTSDIELNYRFEYAQLTSASKHEEVLFMTTLSAPEFVPTEFKERAALDIICVIDRSGSMGFGKLDLVKKTLLFMIDQLKPKDRISIVGFDSDVYRDLDSIDMSTKSNRQKAQNAVSKMHPGSCTNLSGGLFQAYANYRESRSKQRSKSDASSVCSILLFTDGLANVGLQNTAEIIKAMENITMGLGQGVNKPSVFTFGFGADHDASMLTAIAEAGSGMYYYIQKEDEIPASFGDVLGGLVSVVAQNMKLTLRSASPGVKIGKVLSTLRDSTLSADGTTVTAHLGDIYSEEKKDFLFSLTLPQIEPTEQDLVPIVQIDLDYFSTIESNLKKKSIVASVGRPLQVSTTLLPDLELDKQRNRIISTDALLAARRLADSGQLSQGRQVLTDAMARIKSSASHQDAFCQGLISDLQTCLETLRDTTSYSVVGQKMMSNYWQANNYQRSTGQEQSAVQSAYATSSKVSMRSKFSAN